MLSNKEIINSIWMTTQENVKLDDVHQQCSLSNDFLIKSCLNRKCLDNITLVVVAFENFERIFSYPDYPVLHTYEDQPVAKKLLATADNLNINRNSNNNNSIAAKKQNFEKINKIRSDSVKNNNNLPASSKGPRPKINNFEENNAREMQNNGKNGFMKQMTPLNSSKER
jgi:hypothetical protein